MDALQDLVGGHDRVQIALAAAFGALCIVIALLKIQRKRDAFALGAGEAKARGNPSGNSTKKHAHAEKASKEKPKSHQTKSKKKDLEKDNRGDKEVKDAWLFATLKGHTGSISSMDYSANGKYLATCANDRTVLLWEVRDVAEKARTSCKSFRVNLDGDSADLVRWSPDSRAFVIHRALDNSCQVYRVEKKDGGGFVTTPTKTFAQDTDSTIISVSLSPDGKFILTATDNNILTLWDLKGPTEITRIDTTLKLTTYATVTACGQFIAACGTHAVVWAVQRKDREAGAVKKAFDLKDVCHLSFDGNGTRLATVAPSGDWMLYNIPPEIHSRLPILQAQGKITSGGTPPKVALSPQGETLVVAAGDKISFFKVYRPNEPAELHRTVVVSGLVQQLLFDPQGQYLFAAGGDRHIKVFVNATKYASDMDLAIAKLREPQTSATRERLAQLAQNCQTRLKELCPE